MSSSEAPRRLTHRSSDAHKGDFGRALLIGGSRGMSGSIALSAMAALKTGSGLVTAAVPDRCLEVVAGYHPAVMTTPLDDDGGGRFSLKATEQLGALTARTSAIGCGPGMTTGQGSLRIVQWLLNQTKIPRLFDADALNLLPDLDHDGVPYVARNKVGDLVCTPHPGELERITGVSARQRDAQIAAASELARRAREAGGSMVLVVKGGPTVVVDGNQSWTNGTGNPGMATAGSGDVLTGVITGLLGQGLTPWDAACLGVWVHGRAGDLAASRHGASGMTAVEILAALPEAVEDVVAD